MTTFRIYDRRNGQMIEAVQGNTVEMHEAARRVSANCSDKTSSENGAKTATFDVNVVLVNGSERFHCGYDDEGHLVETRL